MTSVDEKKTVNWVSLQMPWYSAIWNEGGGVKPFGPVYAFSSPAVVVALEGRNVSLRCFFSGL